MEEHKGYVDHIIFRSEQTGYTVLVLIEKGEELTCVGVLPAISEGEMIAARGRMTEHASYGEQFRIDTYEQIAPEGVVQIERYLGSGAIKGIGATMAGRIVRRFGDDTFRIMEEEPERLAEIKGISERKAREIAQQVSEKKEMRDVMLFLSEYGISNTMSVRLYQQYGSGIYTVIRENPYRLADEVNGVGFLTADEIARRAGIEADSDFRIRSAIMYVLGRGQGEGHMYLPLGQLRTRTETMLHLDLTDSIKAHLMHLSVEKKIVIKRETAYEPAPERISAASDPAERMYDDTPMTPEQEAQLREEEQTRVYTTVLYHLEQASARMLMELNIQGDFDADAVIQKIRQTERRLKTTLDEHQREAVLEAVRHGVIVLTGGPGTGKTTTINTMIEYFEDEGLTICLAAPTGRAAKRITEATGREAKTVHRLLEVEGGPEGTGTNFLRNAQNPLEADVVIIDEMSMVDIYLLHALLAAISVGTRLILVGDANQLPSVGPGSVLRDIIASGTIVSVQLTKIFRQAEESDIVMNAHRILRGEHMTVDNQSRDFFMMRRRDADKIIANVIQLVQTRLPKYIHADPSDIQVLTPTRKGLTGVERLNRIMQAQMNPADPDKAECAHGEDGLFREGDKVMQIRNDYEIEWDVYGRFGASIAHGKGVFNGDIGRISRINPYAREVTVVFEDSRTVTYTYSQLDELELSYAVTIHKSQGSEYPAVVIPLLDGPRMLLNRNLLYTAVTRAKNCVMIVGDPDVYYRMIDNTVQQRRYSSLSERLRETARLS